MFQCPCCHQLVETDEEIVVYRDGSATHISTKYGEARLRDKLTSDLFRLLYERGRSMPIAAERIVDYLYADSLEESCNSPAIRQRVRRLRKTLIPTGIVLARGVWNGTGYGLMFLTPSIAATYYKNPVPLQF